MNPKQLTDYECMLLGISRPYSRKVQKDRPVPKSEPLPPSPTTSDGERSKKAPSGEHTETVPEDHLEMLEYVSYLNSLIKRGVPF